MLMGDRRRYRLDRHRRRRTSIRGIMSERIFASHGNEIVSFPAPDARPRDRDRRVCGERKETEPSSHQIPLTLHIRKFTIIMDITGPLPNETPSHPPRTQGTSDTTGWRGVCVSGSGS